VEEGGGQGPDGWGHWAEQTTETAGVETRSPGVLSKELGEA